MISLRDKIVNEGILSSTHSGKDTLIKNWLAQHDGIRADEQGIIHPITSNEIRIEGEIPDYINFAPVKIFKLKHSKDPNTLEKIPQCERLEIISCNIKDFSGIKDNSCKVLAITDCELDSIKNLPKKPNFLYIGNNDVHVTKKMLKKFIDTDQKHIYTIGERNDFSTGPITGSNDVRYCEEQLNEYFERLKKLIPEIKGFNSGVSTGRQCIYPRIDFLSKENIPYCISDNGIFVTFKYDITDSSLELYSTGHLELTDADKAGKYKYYALKGLTDPYYDRGGKKFRKCRLDDFNADELYKRTADWLKEVVDAALEDQGGVLKRR